MRERRAAWRRLVRRRNKAVRLVEELNLRTGRLQPLFDKLHEIAERMGTIEAAARRGRSQRHLGRPDSSTSCAASCAT